MTPSGSENAPPAPSTRTSMAVPMKKTVVPGSAEEALEQAKRRLERMAHQPRDAAAALGEVGNTRYHRRATVGEWSAQAQVDEILRKAKQRTAGYAQPR